MTSETSMWSLLEVAHSDPYLDWETQEALEARWRRFQRGWQWEIPDLEVCWENYANMLTERYW